ncbi:unnamed protein product [Gongylonema pulchrum]|uniref:Uncharacterized protein n=1 Tax=Gongylonema pulchrum TaxID=637853 RepID=A0A183CX94_9BILA|nr:unnamed protein product [Gongylonema pulchrum]
MAERKILSPRKTGNESAATGGDNIEENTPPERNENWTYFDRDENEPPRKRVSNTGNKAERSTLETRTDAVKQPPVAFDSDRTGNELDSECRENEKKAKISPSRKERALGLLCLRKETAIRTNSEELVYIIEQAVVRTEIPVPDVSQHTSKIIKIRYTSSPGSLHILAIVF